MKQRKELVEELFPDAKVGTNTNELGGGWKVKAVVKETVTLSESTLELLLADIPQDVQDRAIKYKPSLVKKEYDKLTDDEREVLDECVVTKPSSPTLEIVPPKS